MLVLLDILALSLPPAYHTPSIPTPPVQHPLFCTLSHSARPAHTHAQAIEIRRKSDAFNERVEDFRKFFLRRAPFAVSGSELKLEHVKPAYAILDAFHHGSIDEYPSVTAIIAESKQLQEAQELFELFQSDYIMLQRCSEELLYLKSLWDMTGAVMYTFNDWYKTPWDKIDVDFLVEETKKLSKDIKTLNKAVRNYEVRTCFGCCVVVVLAGLARLGG